MFDYYWYKNQWQKIGEGNRKPHIPQSSLAFFEGGGSRVGGGNANSRRENLMTWEYQYEWKYNIFRWLAMNMDYIMSVYISTERKQKFQVLTS